MLSSAVGRSLVMLNPLTLCFHHESFMFHDLRLVDCGHWPQGKIVQFHCCVIFLSFSQKGKKIFVMILRIFLLVVVMLCSMLMDGTVILFVFPLGICKFVS